MNSWEDMSYVCGGSQSTVKATEQGYREHCSPSCTSAQLGDNKDEKRITGSDRDRKK